MARKQIFLTDGNGIFKVDRFIKAAVLVNLETQEQMTAEMLGSQISGFAIIAMPSAEEIAVLPADAGGTPKKTASQQKPAKIEGGKKRSRYHGVSMSPHSKKNPWRAQVNIGGKYIHLGSFPTEVAAAKAFDAKLIEMGKSARNFPQARTEG